jgi:predicted transcriptional regulator of viral defense system
MTKINSATKRRLGDLEQRLLSYAQFRRLSVVRTGELRAALELTVEQERKVLSRLARGGTIVRLKRGVYLVPPRLPLDGVWSPGEALILRELMRSSGNGRYQLCGWPVFNRYGFTEQVPARVYAYNNRISGDRIIGGIEFSFIKVSDGRLGATEAVRTTGGSELVVPTKARALMDAVFEYARFGTLPEALDWIRKALAEEKVSPDDLADTTRRFGNQGTMRRIGFMLAEFSVSKPAVRRLRRALTSKASLIRLVPGRPAKGPVDREWGVIDNE